MPIIKEQQRTGDNTGKRRAELINRTGATLNKGDVVAVDMTGSDSDVDDYATWVSSSNPTPEANPLANVINVATAHLDGWRFAVCLEDSLADDGRGTFLFQGIAQVSVDGSLSNGDRLTGSNGNTYLVSRTDGAADLGQLLEANASGTNKRWVDFDGLQPASAGSAT